jgi:hypothetical protein
VLYKPSRGKGKDSCVVWHDGRFSLFCMHRKDGGEYRNVWMAQSADGVHWEDVGPVIEEAPFPIWAMSVHEAGGRFILNHGSFGAQGAQNVLKFWQSGDLRDWSYMGEDYDVTPHARDSSSNARLDCMNVIRAEGAYYGYATGPRGFLRSEDGLRWHFCDTRVDFGEAPPPPIPADEGLFEVGGCCEIAGRYYYLGGWFNYMGRTGYGVHTLVSDKPWGPFTPDVSAYRLCGNSTRWVSLWARPCPTDREVLVNSYMQDGFSYEDGDTWTPPLKKAVVDEHGHLRLAYWEGNDTLTGARTDIGRSGWRVLHAGEGGTRSDAGLLERTADGALVLKAREFASLKRIAEEASVALLELEIDARNGTVVQGTIEAGCADPRLVSPSAGLVLAEDEHSGTAIWLDACGATRIGRLSWETGLSFTCEDTIDRGCGAPAGIAPGRSHPFRLFVRRCMFELYVDGMLVQTFNTSHSPDRAGQFPRRVGFLSRNGLATLRDLRINGMTL